MQSPQPDTHRKENVYIELQRRWSPLVHPYYRLNLCPAPTLLHLCKTCGANDFNPPPPSSCNWNANPVGWSFTHLYAFASEALVEKCAAWVSPSLWFEGFVFKWSFFFIFWTLPTLKCCATPRPKPRPNCSTCRGNKELLLLSVRKMFSSIQDLGPSDPPERGNLGGAMTLLEKGFFRGEAWLTDPGTPIPLPLRWSRPQDIPPEPQPLPWWLPQGDGFTMGCRDT